MSRVEASIAPAEMNQARKATMYGTAAVLIVVLDQITKYLAQQNLPPYQPVPVLGEFFRLTYIYNTGAAFGLSLGDQSRWIFLGLTVVVLVVLALWFRSTPESDRLRLVALTALTGGAIGNFIDRARSPRGVVDFFDVGLGSFRWPVFNIADIGVTVGAVLLAISLWKEEQAAESDERTK